MTDARILARIDAWHAAGLIDGETADALRATEAAGDGDRPPLGSGRIPGAAALFGPGVSVGEMFGYLGGAFLLAAWFALIGRLTSESAISNQLWAAGIGLAAAVVGGLGLRLRTGAPRLRRAAGVGFLVSTGLVAWAAYALVNGLVNGAGYSARQDEVPPALAGAAAGLLAAVAYRRIHPALATQLALIGAILAATAALMRWLELILFGQPSFEAISPSPDSPLRVVLIAAGWGVAAVVLGVLGLAESRGRTLEADGRAALTRLAAGLTAVLGTASAVFADGVLANDGYGRLIPPVVGDAALIGVSVILLERAFRRDASAFVYPAALGVIIGLTDLNAQYLAAAAGAEVALLAEGAILLAAGLGFDRLRRRLGRGTTGMPAAPADRMLSPDPPAA